VKFPYLKTQKKLIMKNSTVLKNKMKGLSEGEGFLISYKNEILRVQCFHVYNGDNSISIRNRDKYNSQSMNIRKITDKYITLYDFDMFQNSHKAKILISEIEIF
tara:strand:- start:223 stop:534 length:312 start_codon:yes stop_codon:yes gene_type:complete